MHKALRALTISSLLSLGLTGCVNGFWFGVGPKEGVIKPSLKPYEAPVYAPVMAITPEPFKPDPPIFINPNTGSRENAKTGELLRGSAVRPAAVKVIAAVKVTADGHLIDAVTGAETGYVLDAARGVFVNAKGETLNIPALKNAAVGSVIVLPADSAVVPVHLVDAATGADTGYYFNPVTGTYVNAQGDVLNVTALQQASIGSVVALPSDAPLAVALASSQPALPSSDPNTAIKTVDGLRVSDVDAGSTLFIETKGLKPNTDYTGTLVWPNGKTTIQPLKSTAGGNISGPQGNFIEYPHIGFYEADITAGKPGVITGQFQVQITETGSTTPTQSAYFTVRPRPVIFAVSDTFHERTVFFSDRPDKIYLHGEGLPANTRVNLWVVVANINRFTPLTDGLTLDDKIFENFKSVTYRTNAEGVFDTQLMAWPKRAAVTDSLVAIGKYLNSANSYVAAEDVAISDHPTFLIKSGADFFGAIDPAAVIRAK